MRSNAGSPEHSLSDSQPSIPFKSKKPYNAPKFTLLRPDQAGKWLKAKGLTGDPLVDLVAEPDRGTR
jgi:hypothetical protein